MIDIGIDWAIGLWEREREKEREEKKLHEKLVEKKEESNQDDYRLIVNSI